MFQRNPQNSKSLALHEYFVWIVAGLPDQHDCRQMIEITEN